MSRSQEILEKLKTSEFEQIDEARYTSVVEQLVDMNKFIKAFDAMESDKQSQDLLEEIYTRFEELFRLESNEEAAFNQFRNFISSKRYDPALSRNIIFKIANLLKIKLPSSFF